MASDTMPHEGRLLGLDAGERRIGVAISDPGQTLAFPFRTVEKDGSELADLGIIAVEEDAIGLVVGLPLSLSGEAGPQAERVRAFARELEKALNLPIAFWDERLSSREAERILAQEGVRGRPGKRSGRGPGRRPDRGASDVVAATIILQTFLDSRRGHA
jgi:putative Holliday junction resolvase